MNHRFVVPALGLIALSASAASAQEIAKGLFLDGYIDTIFTGTTYSQDNSTSDHGTTDFTTDGILKVGYNIGDKVKALVSTKASAGGNSFGILEAYGTIDAGNGLSISSGTSFGPFGYYSGYSTGITTVNYALSTKLYTINPVGVWATYTANDQFNATLIVADGLANGDGNFGKPLHDTTTSAAANNNVSVGADFVFNPTSEVSLNLEGYIDPNAGGEDNDGKAGHITTIGFNAQYKMDAILAAGEVIYRSTPNQGAGNDKTLAELAWAAFATYTIPETSFPMAATLQVSQYSSGTDNKDTLSKVQAALLTNPTGASQLGVNLEVFYEMDNKEGNTSGKDDSSLGLALEAMYIIP